jgi:hypothetical protein
VTFSQATLHRDTDFLHIFAGKKWRFRLKIMQKFDQICITLVCEKKIQFFHENCRKSQKIVIITLTPEVVNVGIITLGDYRQFFNLQFLLKTQIKFCHM